MADREHFTCIACGEHFEAPDAYQLWLIASDHWDAVHESFDQTMAWLQARDWDEQVPWPG